MYFRCIAQSLIILIITAETLRRHHNYLFNQKYNFEDTNWKGFKDKRQHILRRTVDWRKSTVNCKICFIIRILLYQSDIDNDVSIKSNSKHSAVCWKTHDALVLKGFFEKVSHAGHFFHLAFECYVNQLICSRTIHQTYLCNPSIPQTTIAASVSKSSSQTVPHVLLWNTSTRPSDGEAPPTRRIGVCAEKRQRIV